MGHIGEGIMRIVTYLIFELLLHNFPGFTLGAFVGALQCGLFFVFDLPESDIVIGVTMFTSMTISGVLCEYARRYMSTD